MAFESFYGGRPGASLVIVKHYEGKNNLTPYQQMVEEFREGGLSTSEVNYGEYVVLDNKLDSQHGEVYRRGVNYGRADGGAEYIGNMAGPKGEPGGIHIIGRVNSLTELDNKKPEDYGAEYKGQVMAVSIEGSTIPDLYAYDYVNNEWFYFGNLPSAPHTVIRRTVDYDDIA